MWVAGTLWPLLMQAQQQGSQQLFWALAAGSQVLESNQDCANQGGHRFSINYRHAVQHSPHATPRKQLCCCSVA
jgi:hypothetical protein